MRNICRHVFVDIIYVTKIQPCNEYFNFLNDLWDDDPMKYINNDILYTLRDKFLDLKPAKHILIDK